MLGTLHVADGGVSFTPTTSTPKVDLPDKVVAVGPAFGPTDASISVAMGIFWTLRPIPVDARYTVDLDDSRFGHPAKAVVTKGWWRLSMDAVRGISLGGSSPKGNEY